MSECFQQIYNKSIIVRFGKCVQNKMSVEEPIEWYAIKKAGNGIKLLSRYILDVATFDGFMERTDWLKTSLYDKLNHEFTELCFTDNELFILDYHDLYEHTGITNELDQKFNFVSLLSKSEAETLPKSLLAASLTPNAISKLGYNTINHDSDNTFKYWTRDVNDESRVSMISANGEILKTRSSSKECWGVRPVIWVNYEQGLFSENINFEIIKSSI